MDNFNLNAMGVKEMDSKELRKTNGGGLIDYIYNLITGGRDLEDDVCDAVRAGWKTQTELIASGKGATCGRPR